MCERRPLLSALVSGGLLVALAVPALGLHTEVPGTDSLPRDLEVMQTYDRIKAAFPQEGVTKDVVVQADDVTAAPVTAAIERLANETTKRKDLFTASPEVEVSPDKSVAVVSVPTAGDRRVAREPGSRNARQRGPVCRRALPAGPRRHATSTTA